MRAAGRNSSTLDRTSRHRWCTCGDVLGAWPGSSRGPSGGPVETLLHGCARSSAAAAKRPRRPCCLLVHLGRVVHTKAAANAEPSALCQVCVVWMSSPGEIAMYWPGPITPSPSPPLGFGAAATLPHLKAGAFLRLHRGAHPDVGVGTKRALSGTVRHGGHPGPPPNIAASSLAQRGKSGATRHSVVTTTTGFFPDATWPAAPPSRRDRP